MASWRPPRAVIGPPRSETRCEDAAPLRDKRHARLRNAIGREPRDILSGEHRNDGAFPHGKRHSLEHVAVAVKRVDVVDEEFRLSHGLLRSSARPLPRPCRSVSGSIPCGFLSAFLPPVRGPGLTGFSESVMSRDYDLTIGMFACDPQTVFRRSQALDHAARHVSALYRGFPAEITVAGGHLYSRILKAAKPADLPVAQSTRLELIIDHQTARMLGLTVPATVLSIADEVRKGCRLLRCVRTRLARSRHVETSRACPLSEAKRTSGVV